MEIKFVRFGGLSPVKQDGFNKSMPTFHCPPAKRGIYAFVKNYIEFFLLGSENFKYHRMEWIKKGGKKVEVDAEIEEHVNGQFAMKAKDGKWYFARHKERKVFEHKGDLWHHLDCPHQHVIKRMGSWVKTSFSAYKKALKKELGKMEQQIKREGIPFSKDHLEVFIERVK